ncbi:MAG TPA: MarR family transcriptional regulator [Anaerolineales bacterium]
MESDLADPSEICAGELVEVIPQVMRSIRAEMRGGRAAGLSVPQLRALVFLRDNPSACLSELAEHIGVGLPSMSKMVDSLVDRGMVKRQTSPSDRRYVMLALTSAGGLSLEATRLRTRENLAGKLKGLNDAQRTILLQALDVLRQAFLID